MAAKRSPLRQMSVAAAAKRVQKLSRLGVKASIVPEGTVGKFRIETASQRPKRKATKKKATKKKATKRKATKRKATKKKATKRKR